jgi:hypothetical protein
MVFVTRCTGLSSWGLPPSPSRFACMTVSFCLVRANAITQIRWVKCGGVKRSEHRLSEKLPMPSSFHTAHVPNATHIAGVPWIRFPSGIAPINPNVNRPVHGGAWSGRVSRRIRCLPVLNSHHTRTHGRFGTKPQTGSMVSNPKRFYLYVHFRGSTPSTRHRTTRREP